MFEEEIQGTLDRIVLRPRTPPLVPQTTFRERAGEICELHSSAERGPYRFLWGWCPLGRGVGDRFVETLEKVHCGGTQYNS